jgi:heat shock protein HtpX
MPSLNTAVQRSHNVRNSLHTWILILGFAALAAAIAWTVFGPTGLIAAAAVAIMGLYSAGNVSPKMVLGLYKARPLGAHELPELQAIVQELAARAELPTVPRLHYVPSQMLNAFAVGRAEDSAIAVTDGLLRAMNMRQLAGILAHETAHIRNGDLKVMALADVMARITSMMSWAGILGVPAIFGLGFQLPIAGVALLLAAPTIGGMLQLGLSRAREYDADLDGATLSGDPEGLASALAALERKQSRGWEGLVLPGGRSPVPSYLRTHPKTEDRIARLTALVPGGGRQIVLQEEPARTSIVPPIRRPQVHWVRMGIWY